MKKILFGIFLLLGVVSSAFAADRMYGKGQGFLGAEAGFIGDNTDFHAGIIGGYQYYFPQNLQFSGFRHGVRGIGNVSFATDKWGNKTYVPMALSVIADWTLEFTPASKFNWGIFVGLGGLYVSNSDNYNYRGDGFLVNLGGSLNINNTHRIELAVSNGLNVLTVRYAYMF